MTTFGNPMDFWKQHGTLAKKAEPNIKPRMVFNLPSEVNKAGLLVFEEIGKYLCRISLPLFESKAYINLDELWKSSQNPEIVKWREYNIGNNKTLFDKYPTPFCGRRAYLVSLPFESVEIEQFGKDGKPILDTNKAGQNIMDDKNNAKIKTMPQIRVGGLKAPSHYSKGQSWNVHLYFCAFDSVEYKKSKAKPAQTFTNPETGETVSYNEDEGQVSNEWDYISMYAWVHKDYGPTLLAEGDRIKANYPDVESLMGFALCEEIKEDTYNNKKRWSMNLDYILFMGE